MSRPKYTTLTFIEKARSIHGDKYDYSRVVFVDCKTKIPILCKEHNTAPFLQTPTKHLQKQGCPKCGCYAKFTTEEFIERAKQIHDDKYDYSLVNYVNSQTKILIICKKHSDQPFEQVPNSHLQGCGCMRCGTESTDESLKKCWEDFLKNAIQIHENKYDYSEATYVNALTNITIKCPLHDKFEQTPSVHINSRFGCPECAKKGRGDERRLTTADFIRKAKDIHKDTYDYKLSVYTGCEDQLIILCPIHGEFKQQANNHLQGKGCVKCGQILFYNSRRSNTIEFIEKSKEIHQNRYDYSYVEYTSSYEKIKIICKTHGPYEQTPCGHLRGSGCQKCGYNSISMSKSSSKEEFIEKAVSIHGDTYDYSEVVYRSGHDDVSIICKLHGIFQKRPNNHISGLSGCQKCQSKKQHSKLQIQWLNFVQSYRNIDTIIHAENGNEFKIPGTLFKADGYDPDTNTIYEFHGDYWHGNPKRFIMTEVNKTTNTTFGELYQNTKKKEKQILGLGYNLVVMWEYDWVRVTRSISILQRIFKNKIYST